MDVTGLLSPNKARLQGSIGHQYYFSKENQIAMQFMSDAVVGAVGFTGTVMTMDCSHECGSTFNLGSLLYQATIESPNFNIANFPYCPELDCKWRINVEQGYYANFNYRNFDLRKPDATNDTIVITDRFESVIRSYYSGGPVDLTETNIITGPVTIAFKSSSQTQFSFDKLGSGFKIDVYAEKQKYIYNNVILTDNQYSVDLSQNNFDTVEVTYSYLVQARPGKKVSLYVMTSIEDQAFVTIYDGADTNAALIDTSVIANTDFNRFTLSAPRVTSTGQYMLIHIRPGTDREPGRQTQDFQAIVSDYESPANCGSYVRAVNPPKSSVSPIAFKANEENCQMIMRAVDTTNAVLLASHWSQITNPGQIKLYKGLVPNSKYQISTDVSPLFIYDRNTVVQYSGNISFVYSWDHTIQNELPLTVTDGGGLGSLMTQDYLPYGQKMAMDVSGKGTVQQSFGITPIGNTKSLTLNFLKPIGGATVQIRLQYSQGEDKLFIFTQDNIKSKLSYNCNRMIISYSAPRGDNNGLYATFEAVYSPSNSKLLAVWSTIIVAFMVNQLV